MSGSTERALQRWLADYAEHRHEGLPGDERLMASEIDGISLGLVPDEDENVSAAGFVCERDADAANLLEAYCRSVIGLPIREAFEHGPSRLLGKAKADGAAGQVMGILLPANAGHPFDLLARLTGTLASGFGADKSRNEYHHPPAEGWLALGDDGREDRLRSEIEAFLADVGQPGDVIQLDMLENDLDGHPVRVTVDFGFGLDPAAKPGMVRSLEGRLKSAIDRSLQVYVVERRDESKLRRL